MNEQQAKQAIAYLTNIASFNGHTDVYNWATDPKTSELMDNIRALLKQVDRHALWTDYPNRFEVQEKDNHFLIWDYATDMTLGGHEFKTELEAEVFREEFIEYDKQQETYFNKSGR
jgi:hypothetical protein